MRITESQLRRVVKRLMKEQPGYDDGIQEFPAMGGMARISVANLPDAEEHSDKLEKLGQMTQIYSGVPSYGVDWTVTMEGGDIIAKAGLAENEDMIWNEEEQDWMPF